MLSRLVRRQAGAYLTFDLESGAVWHVSRIDSADPEENGTWSVERLGSDLGSDGEPLVIRGKDGTVERFVAGTDRSWHFARWDYVSGFHRTRADALASISH